MVGQSFDVAVLALIDAPSTSEVTALIRSGVNFLASWAEAPLQQTIMPSPTVIAARARRGCRARLAALSDEKWQAKSARGKRIISSSLRSLADLSRCYLRRRCRQSKDDGPSKKR